MSRRLFVAPLFILLTTVEACAPARTAPDTTAVAMSYQSLVEHLRTSGLQVQAEGEIEQPFFTPQARVIRIGTTGEAQVYEYGSDEAAAADAAKVQSDGSIGGSMPMWVAPPHFFRRRNLIVLYLGSDDTALRSLRGLLGDEFAGRR